MEEQVRVGSKVSIWSQYSCSYGTDICLPFSRLLTSFQYQNLSLFLCFLLFSLYKIEHITLLHPKSVAARTSQSHRTLSLSLSLSLSLRTQLTPQSLFGTLKEEEQKLTTLVSRLSNSISSSTYLSLCGPTLQHTQPHLHITLDQVLVDFDF